MFGKDKCRILHEIRRQIAENNDIELITSECTHKGDCKGTCPKCESELRYLEEQLEKRRRLGKKVALSGISLATMISVSGCKVIDTICENIIPLIQEPDPIEQLLGEVPDTGYIEMVGDVPYLNYVPNEETDEEPSDEETVNEEPDNAEN